MKKNLMYLYDPLCGWCYGMTPSLLNIANDADIAFQLIPTGLFAGEQPKPMDDELAEFAWSNDQRIASLTGQVFSARYQERVLGNRQQAMDSSAATLALTAVSQTEPDRELQVLKVIQQARFIEGEDITSEFVLIAILKKLALNAAALMMENRDADFIEMNNARIELARSVQQTYASYSVPSFVVTNGKKSWKLNAREFYTNPHALLEQLAEDEPPYTTLTPY